MSWIGDVLEFIGGTVRSVLLFVSLVLIVVGILLSMTLLGAVIGVPLIVVGVLLLFSAFIFFPRRRAKVVYRVKKDKNTIDVEAKK